MGTIGLAVEYRTGELNLTMQAIIEERQDQNQDQEARMRLQDERIDYQDEEIKTLKKRITDQGEISKKVTCSCWI